MILLILLIVDNLKDFNVRKTYIDGKLVAENGCFISTKYVSNPNIFKAKQIVRTILVVPAKCEQIQVLQAIDGQLITKKLIVKPKVENGNIISDIENDNLKIVVVNRYKESTPAIGFIKGFGFKQGAIASTVAHDSHNIIAVGTNDEEIVKAINLLIESNGGISLVDGDTEHLLSLPVAGIMSNEDGYKVARNIKH